MYENDILAIIGIHPSSRQNYAVYHINRIDRSNAGYYYFKFDTVSLRRDFDMAANDGCFPSLMQDAQYRGLLNRFGALKKLSW
jgi:hypothetical protein